MSHPITKLLRLRQKEQMDLDNDVLTSNLSEIRVKIQCLQKYFLEQSRNHLTADSKGEVKIS